MSVTVHHDQLAVLNDAGDRLGIDADELGVALELAYDAQIDAQLACGEIDPETAAWRKAVIGFGEPYAGADSVLLAYGLFGVTLAAAEALGVRRHTVESSLRLGRSLRELAHELRLDPEDLQLAIAVVVSEGRDEAFSDAMYVGTGELLDRRLPVSA